MTQDNFADARELQWLWKTQAMLDMAIALVGIALEKPSGFAADDLPGEFDHGGSGIAGSIMAVLVNRGLIRRSGLRRGELFFGLERVSKRAGRKDAKVKVFELADRRKAESFLIARHRVRELQQGDLLECR